MTETFDDNGIYYTIDGDHAYVGTPTKSKGNALSDKDQKKIEIKSKVRDVPVTEVTENAFYEVKGITSITFPDTLKIIKRSAFDVMRFSCPITLPSNLEYIGQRAFAGCCITSIHIPASVTYIGSSPFGTCPYLTSITIDENNKHYIVTKDFSIYNKMKTILVQAMMRTNVTIEPTVIEMGYGALVEIINEELVFPEKFSVIKYGAVLSCNNIKSVRFLGNLNKIEAGAFYLSNNLQNIYYYGTKSVRTAMFSRAPSNVYVCIGYKSLTFATLSITSKSGECPLINYIKRCTSHCKRSSNTYIIKMY